MPFEKYRPYPAVELPDRTWPDKRLESAPIWCSVDLRDGNQALVDPMDSVRKRRMWDRLVEIGFTEIEVGFPAASQTDFDFVRELIEEDLIPDGVTIQVLTQCREDLIRRTFESIEGAKSAIVHFYNSTSTTQRRVVFRTDRAGIIDIAVQGAKLCKSSAMPMRTRAHPLRVLARVLHRHRARLCRRGLRGGHGHHRADPRQPAHLQPSGDGRDVDPQPLRRHDRTLSARREEPRLDHPSLHPHNDRGTGVAAAELGMMAGADRVEGTLFGNGERTGNVDVVTIALNMFTQGVDPELDFTDIEEARRVYEFSNRMTLPDRQPYVGDLVFTAFSGSHQDAIKKGMADIYDVQPGEPLEGEYDAWDVPYLPIDPRHLGRSYEAVIRVNSQSGKGGVAYVLLHEYGLDLPRQLQVDFAKKIQAVTEDTGTEITSYEIHRRFMSAYVEPVSPKVEIIGHRSSSDTLESGTTTLEAKLIVDGKEQMVSGEGNGPIDAFVAALTGAGLFDGKIADYSEHTMGSGSDASAVAYVEIDTGARNTTWGVGIHESIVSASLRAIVSAVNTLRAEPNVAERVHAAPELARRRET